MSRRVVLGIDHHAPTLTPTLTPALTPTLTPSSSAAWDAGVNFLDTAEGYPVPMTAERQGATDRAIGRCALQP